MTVDESSGHLRAAADCVNDARTELNRAEQSALSEATESLIERFDEVAEDMERTLREVAVNAEVAEAVEEATEVLEEEQ